LLAQSAEAFSPVLFLRGAGSVIFDFTDRRVLKQGPKRLSKGLSPALQSLLERPFTMVVGDVDEDPSALKAEFLAFLKENGDAGIDGLSLSALAQRCTLKYGTEYLQSLFQQVLMGSAGADAPPLIRALARFAGPGVHVTLLWKPHLERAVAEAHPKRNV